MVATRERKAGPVPAGFKKIYLRGGKNAPEGREVFKTDANARYYLVPTTPEAIASGLGADVVAAAADAGVNMRPAAGTNDLQNQIEAIEGAAMHVLDAVKELNEVERNAALHLAIRMLPLVAA